MNIFAVPSRNVLLVLLFVAVLLELLFLFQGGRNLALGFPGVPLEGPVFVLLLLSALSLVYVGVAIYLRKHSTAPPPPNPPVPPIPPPNPGPQPGPYGAQAQRPSIMPYMGGGLGTLGNSPVGDDREPL